MPKVISALTARTQLGQIMRRVKDSRERFVIDRRGEPQAVIMGIEDFIDTIAPPPEFLAALQASSRRKGLNKLPMREIDAEIDAARRERGGKKVTKRRAG